MKKTLCFLFLLFLYSLKSMAFESLADYAVLIDVDSGAILYEKNAKEKMYPSSMSKIMTAYVVFDKLKKGDIALDDTFTNNKTGWKAEGSRMFIPLNEKVTVKDLLRGLIIQSGNDAAITLAEGIAGSEPEFADIMNHYAKELNLVNSNFANASGLPNENHYSSAYDLATIAVATINNFPEYYPMYKETEFVYNNIKQQNRNTLLYNYNGADGLKTGHTDNAGYGLVASAAKNGKRLVAVVNGLKSTKDRAIEAEKILNYGFLNYSTVTIAEKDKILAKIPVYYGNENFINAVSNKEIKMLLPKNIAENITVEVQYNSPLQAPIKKGMEIAKLVISSKKDGKINEFSIFAQDDIEKSGILRRIIQNTKYFFAD